MAGLKPYNRETPTIDHIIFKVFTRETSKMDMEKTSVKLKHTVAFPFTCAKKKVLANFRENIEVAYGTSFSSALWTTAQFTHT
jgi:hypothetical protein